MLDKRPRTCETMVKPNMKEKGTLDHIRRTVPTTNPAQNLSRGLFLSNIISANKIPKKR